MAHNTSHGWLLIKQPQSLIFRGLLLLVLTPQIPVAGLNPTHKNPTLRAALYVKGTSRDLIFNNN